MIVYGLPTAITSCLFPISNMQIAAGVNSYGADFVAGSTASQQYEKMLGSYNVGLAATTLTMMGQNLGAKKKERVYRVFFTVLILEFCLILGTASIIYAFGETLIPIFTGNNAAAVEAGMLRMRIMLFSYCILHVPTAPAMQAFGHPTLQTVINVGTVLGLRTFWMQVIYPLNPTLDTLYFCYPLTYIVNFLSYVPIVAVLFLQLKKDKYAYKI